MATEKTKQKTEEVKLTYDQELLKDIKSLEASAEKAIKEFEQYIGALNYARMAYDKYMKSIEPVDNEELKE